MEELGCESKWSVVKNARLLNEEVVDELGSVKVEDDEDDVAGMIAEMVDEICAKEYVSECDERGEIDELVENEELEDGMFLRIWDELSDEEESVDDTVEEAESVDETEVDMEVTVVREDETVEFVECPDEICDVAESLNEMVDVIGCLVDVTDVVEVVDSLVESVGKIDDKVEVVVTNLVTWKDENVARPATKEEQDVLERIKVVYEGTEVQHIPSLEQRQEVGACRGGVGKWLASQSIYCEYLRE